MEQKDIDRLLAGRKAIDEIKRPDVDVVNTLNLTTKKSEAVSLAVVKQSLAELDALRKIESDSIIAAEKQLVELGFAGIGDFLEFNRQMVLAEHKEMVAITTLGCKSCPTQQCVKRFGAPACSTSVNDGIYKFFLHEHLRSSEGIKGNYSDIERTCPAGYGFQWKIIRNEQFDLGWRYNG